MTIGKCMHPHLYGVKHIQTSCNQNLETNKMVKHAWRHSCHVIVLVDMNKKL